MQTPSLLVVFQEDVVENYKELDEPGRWNILQDTFHSNAYFEKPPMEVLDNYQKDKKYKYFYELQLRFYIIRYAYNKQITNLNDTLHQWLDALSDEEVDEYGLLELRMRLDFVNNTEKKYVRYIYPAKQLNEYFNKWFDQSITLELWKKYNHIIISNDFEFDSRFKYTKQPIARNTVRHIMLLFDQYVEEVYRFKMEPSIKKSELKTKELAILDRLSKNTSSNEDKNYLARTFNLSPLETISEDISKCLSNKLKITNYDIHSRKSLAVHCALIKYYNALKLSKKRKRIKYSIYFKNMPEEKEKRDVVYEKLHYLYDEIKKRNYFSIDWKEFRSIFSKNGSNIKIKWNADAKELSFIFRKFYRRLDCKPKKWEAVSHYFNPNNEESLNPESLESNTKRKKDEILEKLINDIISSLNHE